IVPPDGLVTFNVSFCPSNGVHVPGAFTVNVPVALAVIFAIPNVQFGVMLVAVDTLVRPVVPVPPFPYGSVPVIPVLSGKPVALVSVTDVGVPRTGVTSVGDVANTAAPDPVSLVIAAARFALEGVARNVATPEPRPLTPVEIGNPVALVSVTDVGVPRTGVTSVCDVANTAAPVPVSSVNAAARLALEGVARNVPTPVPNPLTLPIGKLPVTPPN